MKCPACVEAGLKSTIAVDEAGVTTDMYYPPWYDEEGKYHVHDANASGSGGRCSEGHELWIERAKSCPSCDWGSPKTVTLRG